MHKKLLKDIDGEFDMIFIDALKSVQDVFRHGYRQVKG